jgi:hypothetical protein
MEGSVVTVVGRVVAAVAVVAGSVVLGGSAQAAVVTRQADSGQITSPADGQVVTSSSVTVSARTGVMQLSMGLYVEGPSTPKQKVAGGGANQTLSGTFATGSAPNGTFTVTLKGEITGTRYASSTFKLRRPPEAPGNVNASLHGSDKAEVTWSKGTEPDLQSYEVSTSQSGIVGRLPADNACSGSSCKAVLAVPAKAAGQRVGFTVKAFRGDGDGGSIGSGNSGAAYITVPAAPTAAQPKKQTTNTQQAPKTGSKKAVDPLPTLPAKKQTVPTTAPTRKPSTTHKSTSTLPAMPDTDAKGNLPIPTADTTTEDQGETNGLAPTGAKNDTNSAPLQAGGVKAQSNESPIGNIGQYGFYVAGGLLLLLLAANVGAWARRRSLAANGGGAGAVAAPPPPASGGAHVPQSDDGTPPTATPPRRPAVVLAVAKTRAPEPPQERPKPPVPDRSRTEMPTALPLYLGIQDVRATQDARQVSPLDVHGVQDPRRIPVLEVQDPRQELALDVHGVQDPRRVSGQDVRGARDSGRELVEDVREVREPGRGSRQDAPVTQDERAAQNVRGRQELRGGAAQGARPEPVRIALPSSAVTDVPDPSNPVIPPAVPIEDRWDDYLPPSPRSMEDSGFWERPQPGAADFWAADDDERAYAGRRHKGEES